MLEAFCARVLRLGAERPAAARRPAATRATRPRSSEFLSDRRGSRVEVRAPAARREAAAPGARRPERAARARVRPAPVRAAAPAPRRGARGAARGAEPREPADPDRVLRHLEHPGRVAGRLDGRLPGRGAEEGALPEVRRAARSTGPDDFAAIAEVVSRRFARLGDVTADGVRRVVRGGAEPGRDRRRQGPALGGARGDAGVRPAARGGDLAREAGGGGVRPGPRRPDRARRATRPGCSSCSGSATRRTASRSASTGSARDAGARLDLRRPAGRRPGAPPRAAAALRLGRAAARGDPGGARRACRASRRRPRGRSTRSSTGQAGHEALAALVARACSRSPAAAAESTQPTTVETVKLPTTTTSARSGQGRDRGGSSRRRAAGKTDALWGMLSTAVEAAPRADARRVQERRRRSSSRTQSRLLRRLQGDRLGAAHAGVRDRRDRRPTERQARVYAVPLRLEGTSWRVELGGPVDGAAARPAPGEAASPSSRRSPPRSTGPGGSGTAVIYLDGHTENPKVAGTSSNATLFANFEPPLDPGRHTVVVFASDGGDAGATAWEFTAGKARARSLRDHEHEDREPPGGEGEEAHAPRVGALCKRTMRSCKRPVRTP